MTDLNIRIGRLRWRSRRGLHELDSFLEPFFSGDLSACNEATLTAMERLLACQDLELLDWLLDRSAPRDPQLAKAIELVRGARTS